MIKEVTIFYHRSKSLIYRYLNQTHHIPINDKSLRKFAYRFDLIFEFYNYSNFTVFDKSSTPLKCFLFSHYQLFIILQFVLLLKTSNISFHFYIHNLHFYYHCLATRYFIAIFRLFYSFLRLSSYE